MTVLPLLTTYAFDCRWYRIGAHQRMQIYPPLYFSCRHVTLPAEESFEITAGHVVEDDHDWLRNSDHTQKPHHVGMFELRQHMCFTQKVFADTVCGSLCRDNPISAHSMTSAVHSSLHPRYSIPIPLTFKHFDCNYALWFPRKDVVDHSLHYPVCVCAREHQGSV